MEKLYDIMMDTKSQTIFLRKFWLVCILNLKIALEEFCGVKIYSEIILDIEVFL